MHRGFPFAAWRMPAKEEMHFLLQCSDEVQSIFPELEQLAPGFLFSPYDADYSTNSTACRYLKADLLFSGKLEELQLISADKSLQQETIETFLQAEQPKQQPAAWYTPERIKEQSCEQAACDQEAYEQLVRQAVQAIAAGQMQKVVCARSKQSKLPANFSLSDFFLRLCKAYPQAFISLVSLPGEGTWVGATPETLISLKDNRWFTTMALAGTQARKADEKLSDAVWRQKEIEEQALVSRYIINCFKKIRLREFDEIGPRTIAAANLIHLRTDFTVDMQATNFPDLGTTMLQLLHPTSAVCGMPKDKAVEFLDAHEQLNRSFFAGFLGPVNIRNQSQLFVNLRCMQLLKDSALLYAGAGITADSDPQREWQETELKCQTLLNQLFAQPQG